MEEEKGVAPNCDQRVFQLLEAFHRGLPNSEAPLLHELHEGSAVVFVAARRFLRSSSDILVLEDLRVSEVGLSGGSLLAVEADLKRRPLQDIEEWSDYGLRRSAVPARDLMRVCEDSDIRFAFLEHQHAYETVLCKRSRNLRGPFSLVPAHIWREVSLPDMKPPPITRAERIGRQRRAK